MQIVTHPTMSPGVDFLLRTANGPFVDTEISVMVRRNPEGMPVKERVYLSFDLIRQLAQVAGIVDQSSSLSEATLIARGKLEGMKEVLGERALELAADLRRLFDDAGNSGRSLDGR